MGGTTRPRTAQGAGKASGLAIVGAVITTAANFLIAWLVSRGGRGDAGTFFVATAFISIVGNGASLGTQTGMVYFLPRVIARADDHDDHGAAGPLLRIALRPVVLLSVGLALLFALLAPAVSALVADGSDDLTLMLRVMAPTIPAFATTVTLLGAARGLGTMTPTVVVNQVVRPGLQIVLLGLAFLGGSPAAWLVAAAWSIPVIAALGAAIVWVVRLGAFAPLAPNSSGSAVSSPEFWAYNRPRSVSTALQLALERIDVILVSAFVGRELAGVYGALSRYITAGNFLIFSVAQAVAPNLRREITRERWTEASALLQRTTGWLVLVAWPYFLLVALHRAPLARVFSEDYVADAGVLIVLAGGMMLSAAAGPIDLTLLMLGRSRESLWSNAAALMADLVLVVLLAPRFGIMGAAAAWAASVAVQNGVASLLVHRFSGLRAWALPATAAAGLAVAAVVPVSLALQATDGDPFLLLIASGAVAGGLWLAGIYLLRRPLGLGSSIGRLSRAPRPTP